MEKFFIFLCKLWKFSSSKCLFFQWIFVWYEYCFFADLMFYKLVRGTFVILPTGCFVWYFEFIFEFFRFVSFISIASCRWLQFYPCASSDKKIRWQTVFPGMATALRFDFSGVKRNRLQKKKARLKPGWHKKTAPEKGRFCGIAASKPLDNHQGCLRVFSLHSHQNRAFSGAKQFCPRILDAESTKRGGASLGGLPAPLNILCAKILWQNRCFLMSHRLNDRAFDW